MKESEQKPFLSIIITAYNIEQYIDRSLSSAISQSYKNIEIIVIDDGSTDNTASVIKAYLSIDDRIRYYYQTNCGVSAARNRSLSLVRGEYFTFLDGDDVLSFDFASNIYNNHTNSDLLIFNYKEQNSKNQLVEKVFKKELVGEFDKDYKATAFLIAEKYPSLWAKAYRTNFVYDNQIKFFDTKTLEDMFFILDLLMLKPRVKYVDAMSYEYLNNENSLSRSIDISVINDRQKVVDYYFKKYLNTENQAGSYFFVFWCNRIFMQLFLVVTMNARKEDLNSACIKTINFINDTLNSMKSYKIARNDFDVLMKMESSYLIGLFIFYQILFFISTISKRMACFVVYFFHFCLKKLG